LLDTVAILFGKLKEIQGRISDEEFARDYLKISRQSYSAYRNGTRDVSLEFLSGVMVRFPELTIPVMQAMDEIGKAEGKQ